MKIFLVIVSVFILIFDEFITDATYLSPTIYTFDKNEINIIAEFGFLEGGHFSLHAIKKPEKYKYIYNDTSIFGLCTFDELNNIGDINPCQMTLPSNNNTTNSNNSNNNTNNNNNNNFNYNNNNYNNFNYNNINNNNNSGIGGGVKNIILKGCKILNLSTLNETKWTGTIDETDYYAYVYFSCFKGTQSIKMEISVESLNPGNNHLSFEYLMFPSTYLAFIVVWSFLSLLWLINYLTHYWLSTKLHWIISLIPISTLINQVYSLILFEKLKSDGALGSATFVFNSLLYSLQLVVLLIVLMLIAMGYAIIPKQFKKVNLLIIVMAIIIFVGTFIGSYYSGHYNYVILITYFPVALFIIFVTQNNIKRIKRFLRNKEKECDMVPIDSSSSNGGSVITNQVGNIPTITITTTSTNTNTDTNINTNTSTNTNTNTNTTTNSNNENQINITKIKSIYYLFISFKWIMVPYVLITIIISLISIYIYQPWIFLFIQFLLNVTLFILIAIVFRLKKSKKGSFYEFFDENNFNDKSNDLE
ncbi:hypothetical protein ACTFIT_001863 [Dictyostelium discoideum]